jgi:hypothetical protein
MDVSLKTSDPAALAKIESFVDCSECHAYLWGKITISRAKETGRC